MYYSCQDPEGGKGDGIFALAGVLFYYAAIVGIALLMSSIL